MQDIFRQRFSYLIVMTGLVLPFGQLSAYQNSPDNSKANKGANGSMAHSADKGAGTASDLQVMKQIRREIVKDKSLSTYGHNVKVLVAGGKVTLKGPVHTDDEKKAIEAHARSIAGDGNVVDELTVKGDSK